MATSQLAFAFPEPRLPWEAVPAPAIAAAPLLSRDDDDFPCLHPDAPPPLADRLVAAGLVPDLATLCRNRCLTAKDDDLRDWPWCLPSRLYRYGLRYELHSSLGPHLFVSGEALFEHPFVQRVARMGFEIRVSHSDPSCGWHHAADLMTAEHWRDLLATRHHVPPECIAGAVSHALELLRIDPRTAREVLGAMGWSEPEGRSEALLSAEGLKPSARADGGTALGRTSLGPTGAWLMVHGIEDRWFAKRTGGGGLVMSVEGMARRGVTRDPVSGRIVRVARPAPQRYATICGKTG